MTEAVPPVIELEDVHKVYRTGAVEVHALRGVSLQIERGEFAAIIGASGSGKSTLMNLLGLLDRPTSGAYRFNGQEVSRFSKRALARLRNRQLGFVFQGFNLIKRQTALENVELPLVYAGVRRRERRARACDLLKLVGLAERADHQPNQLSGGQQQRVAIARALINRPAIVLADEPTGNLDTKNSDAVLKMLRQSSRELNQTVLMITHNPEAAQIADRILHMRDGEITHIEDGRR